MFSGALTITDLNDFITPSQACIKPVEEVKPQNIKEPGAAATQIQVDASGEYYEVSASSTGANAAPTRRKLEQAQISLNDCLACSGCITSAESVLITLQSHDEVRSVLSSNPPPSSVAHRIPILSIAPQSLASLAAAHGIGSPHEAFTRVRAAAHALGFAHVIDISFARHLALREHVTEFMERRAKAALSSKEDGGHHLPMLASACPGWVCYAEKTHAETLPFIAKARSPQAVMGALVKEWAAPHWDKRPEQIYHVSVMPCYDKKLEASRSDFYNAAADSRDVDCVLTTGELDALFRQEGHSLSFSSQSDRPPSPLEPHPSKASLDLETTLPSLIPARGSSSGGYLRAVLEAVHVQNPGSTVEVVKPTADAEELVLRAGTGEVLFRAARCFGFRNVQNMVRRVGRETGVRTARGAAGRMGGAGAVVRRRAAAGGAEANSKDTGRLDYVEVMACPGGCVNGGGQLPPPSQQSEPKDAEGYTRDWESEGVRVQGYAGRWGGKEWTAQVEKMYWAGGDGDGPTPPSGDGVDFGTSLADINTSELASRIIRDICGDDVNGEERRHRLLRTDYRAVESEVLGIAVKW